MNLPLGGAAVVDRRSFLYGSVLTLAAPLAAPLAAEAQPVGTIARPYRVGLLTTAFGETTPSITGLKAGLQTAGLTEGREVIFDSRFTRGDPGALSPPAAALVSEQVDLIYVAGEAAARAAKAATSRIPVVFTLVGDPVAAGLVQTLAHPGGNVTGVSGLSTELAPKRLEILKSIAPSIRRVWAVYSVDDRSSIAAALKIQEAAPGLNLEVIARSVRTEEEAVSILKGIKAGDGLFAPVEPILDIPGRMLIASLWSRLLPVYPYTSWARVGPGGMGALVAYGSDYEAEGAQAALLVAKILRGARPQDLPVEGVNRIHLVINLKTAKALGLTIPPSLLLRADQVIE